MKISSIQKRSSASLQILLDTGEKFILAYDIVIKRGINKNMELTHDDVNSLIRENELFLLRQKSFNLLHRRPQSEAELKLKLLRSRFKSPDIDQLINELSSAGYLNDEDYARTFIDEKINRYGWGKSAVTAALLKRGIKRDIISNILKDISVQDQHNAAQSILEKKFKREQADNLALLKPKMYRFLLSKGYDYEMSREAVKNYIISKNH